MSEPENAATIIELGSCANSEFVKWIEYAYTFSSMLDYSLLTDAEKEMVRLVLNMKMGVGRRSVITMDTVRDLIERHSDHISGNTREFYNGAYAEIADELNAELGWVRERTCTNGIKPGCGVMPMLYCSNCGCYTTLNKPDNATSYGESFMDWPFYCGNCGSKVVSA